MLLSTVDTTTSYLVIALGLVIAAAGSALAIPTLSTGIVLSLPMDKAGVGSAVNDTTREVGGAVGIAVIGSILSSQFRSGIKPALAQLPPEASLVADTARDGVGALAGLVEHAPDIPQLAAHTTELNGLLDVAKSSFVNGLQIGLRVSAAVLVVVAGVLAWWYPRGHLRPFGSPPEDRSVARCFSNDVDTVELRLRAGQRAWLPTRRCALRGR